jgi:serine phosphatase RsbU (regulator of sigma subunit)
MIKNFIPVIFIFFLLPEIAAQEKINDFEELARGYENQDKPVMAAEFFSKAGYAYWNNGNNSQAAQAFQKAYDLFSRNGKISAAVAVANNLGLIYLDSEQYPNAYKALENVLSYSRTGKNPIDIFNALVNVGTVAFELSNFADAIAKINEALNIAKELNNLKYLAKCYSLLAECYEKMDDAANAFKYFELYSAIDKKIKTQEMEDVKQLSADEVGKAHEKKRIAEIELKINKGELKLTKDSLAITERLAFQRQMQVELRNEQLQKKEIQLRYERHLRNYLISGIIIFALFLLVLGYLLRQKLADNKTLRKQKEEITTQRNKLNIQHKKITDSIHYGLRIQQAMLPNLNELKKHLDVFAIYRSKDIVSGDFYWFYHMELENTKYCFVAVVDCTGHGVPGAFMSMIGYRLLTEVVSEHKMYEPAQILEEINQRLRKNLDQENNKTTDGMDICLCRISSENGMCKDVVFAGAKRPLLFYRKEADQLASIEGDRKSIGGFLSGNTKSFTEKKMPMGKGDMLFLYTDGLIDQQNQARERFGSERLTSIIRSNIHKPMPEIKADIELSLERFMKNEEQRDDITILGLKLN